MNKGFTLHHLQDSKKNSWKCTRNGAGFTVILSTILVLTAGLIIILGAGYISLNNIKSIRNNIYSAKSYYIAEAGIEDALLRLRRGMNFSSFSNLTLGEGIATINISDLIGGSRTILSSGSVSNRIRRVRTTYAITTDSVAFYYGAQVGDGGIIMENNSRIIGNVFSNGNITGLNGRGFIDYTAKVATIGSGMEGLDIGQDAYTHNCKDCIIGGSLYYSGGNQENCISDQGVKEHPVQETLELPITDEQILNWKNEALTGGIVLNNYIVSEGTLEYLGPKKIEGDLILQNNAILIITGTLWVTGNITVSNGSIIRLDDGYGSTSGIIIADGRINVENVAEVQGSGQEGSYIMLLSTNFSIDPYNAAIDIKNNAQGAIFFASNGLIRLHNNMQAREVTGYKLYLDNNAIIEYEVGLEDTAFSSGPGGSWEIREWKEVE